MGQRGIVVAVAVVLVAALSLASTFGAAGGTWTAMPFAQDDNQEADDLLEAVDIAWNQEELTLPVGGTLELVNRGQAAHNFVVLGHEPLEDAPIDLPISGESVYWTVPDELEPGDYEYFCDVPGHQQLMRGILTITEADHTAATPEATPVDGTPEVAEDEANALLEAVDIAWNQEEVTLPVGGTLELVNLGQAPHNFVIVGYEPTETEPVDMPIGGESVFWDVPDDLEPGEYEYFCDIPGH